MGERAEEVRAEVSGYHSGNPAVEVSRQDRSTSTLAVAGSEDPKEGTLGARSKRRRGRPWIFVDVEWVRRLHEEEKLSLRQISKRIWGWDGRRSIRPSAGTLSRRLATLKASTSRPKTPGEPPGAEPDSKGLDGLQNVLGHRQRNHISAKEDQIHGDSNS